MDVVRPRPSTVRRARIPVLAAVSIAALGTWLLPPLFTRPAPLPAVERSALVFDVVRRGSLIGSVRAAGQLVPDRVVVVATAADGFVADVPIRAGSRVAADDIIARLRNPDLDAVVADVRAQLDAARAELRSVREETSAAQLDQEAAYRTAGAELARSSVEARSSAALHASGLIGDLSYREALIKAQEAASLVQIARRRIGVAAAGGEAKVATAQAKVTQLQAQLRAREAQVATLTVRAGGAGIVQSVAVDRGQRIAGGTEIARITREADLKAVLHVAEGDVHGVTPGMPVVLDVNGDERLHGRVARIAPAAQNGTVAVDVGLDSVRLGLRPDQNIDGSIELSHRRNVLSLMRPVNAADRTSSAVYRVTPDGTRALRTTVRFGSGSLERIAVDAGLTAGDTVIVSDTSTYDAPQVRIR